MTHLWDSADNLYVHNVYDARNFIVSQTYGDGTLQYQYVTALTGGREYISQVTTTTRKGDTVVTQYRPDGQISQIDHGIRRTVYHYDGSGRVAALVKPGGNGMLYQYDDRGNMTNQRQVAKVTRRTNGTFAT
jgi:YD repeat-containing protein